MLGGNDFVMPDDEVANDSGNGDADEEADQAGNDGEGDAGGVRGMIGRDFIHNEASAYRVHWKGQRAKSNGPDGAEKAGLEARAGELSALVPLEMTPCTPAELAD